MQWQRIVGITLLLIGAIGAFGQTHQIQAQPGPAPGFIAYQALFVKVSWLEKQAEQWDATLGTGNSSSTWIRSLIPAAAGLTDADYAALAAIALDYSQQKAAYLNARNAIMAEVNAAGGKATPAQGAQLSSLFQQYIAMINDHIAQISAKLDPGGVQSLANYVHTTVAATTWWAK